MGKYINPFTDWGFKRLFGQEFSKDLLISFLNDLLEGELHVKDVTFKDKEQLADTKDLRGCIYDVYCETDEGKHFIVEMQNNWTINFVNRTICYASKAITNQREKEKAKLKIPLYDLVPVYVISFMNFPPREGDEVKIFKRLADTADSRCLSKEEMEKYEESQRVVDNYNLGMYSAWYQGNEEGIEKGIEKGKIDTQIATAKNFLAMKLTPEQVAAGTGLSLEDVLALMKKQ